MAVWTLAEVWVIVIITFPQYFDDIQCLLQCHHLTGVLTMVSVILAALPCCEQWMWNSIFFYSFVVVVFRNIIKKKKKNNKCYIKMEYLIQTILQEWKYNVHDEA